MARIQTLVTRKLADYLRSEDGLAAACTDPDSTDEAAAGRLGCPALFEQFIPADLAEKAGNVKYPVVHVYCDRVVNKLTEKFRTFSGTASLAVDVRVTHDRATDLQQSVAFYVEAVTDVLQRHRGDWGDGVFYTGGYEVAFHPVKRGGKNYLQTALITLEAHISI
jgi:hypothetical protein